MDFYLKPWILFCFALGRVDGTGSSCDDIDPLACAQMARQKADLCSDSILSTSACPKFCGNCPITCYNCNTTHFDVASCNTVTCNKDEMCMVKTMKSTNTGHITYALGCATAMYCNIGSKREIQSRSVSIECCNNDLCNSLIPKTSALTSTSTTTTTPVPTTASTTALSHCSSSPCLYGVCSGFGQSFMCKCQSGYIGTQCNIRDVCLHSSCNHGKCVTTSKGGFTCKCNAGYTGALCDRVINPCRTNPCVHGTCLNNGTTYTCRCNSGYTGYLCNRGDPCSLRPCAHGTCSSRATGGFTCTCLSGFTGFLCDTPLGPCASNPCIHGTCVDKGHTYECHCSHGYEGQKCDKDCRRDVVIMVDQSIPLSYLHDHPVTNFLVNLVSNMHNVGTNGMQVAMAAYDSSVHSIWELNTYTDKYRLAANIAVLNLYQINTSPDISIALNYLIQKYNIVKQATGATGERPDVPDVALIITGSTSDRGQHSPNSVRNLLTQLNSFHNVSTILVGVGNVDRSVAQGIGHSLYVNQISELSNSFYRHVLDLIC